MWALIILSDLIPATLHPSRRKSDGQCWIRTQLAGAICSARYSSGRRLWGFYILGYELTRWVSWIRRWSSSRRRSSWCSWGWEAGGWWTRRRGTRRAARSRRRTRSCRPRWTARTGWAAAEAGWPRRTCTRWRWGEGRAEDLWPRKKKNYGAAQHRGNFLASHPAARGSNPRFHKKIPEEKLSKLLRFINGAGQWKEDSGLKMLIEAI